MSEHPDEMNFTYGAFISYRHLPVDIAAAKAVQRALETYRVPADIRKKTGIRKFRRCFRDQDELPLADDLGSSIEKALRESEWLIVICTPDLPQSRWCLREIDFFIGLGRRDRIIPVLVSGEPGESYPPQITGADPERGLDETEPLAADLRGNLKKQLKTEKMRIAARMLNVDFNDLKKRERERALRRGLVLVSAVLVGVVGFAAYALHKNRLLTEERNATARSATELLLEKSVRSTAEGEVVNGLSYALQAYDGSRIFEPEYDAEVSAALEAAMYPELYSQIGSLKDNGSLHRFAFLSNNGKLIACRQADNSMQVYSAVSGERLFVIRDTKWNRKTISPDGRYISRLEDTTLTLYSAADGSVVLSDPLPEGWVFAMTGLTSDNRVTVCNDADRSVGLYDPFTKKLTPIEGITLSGTDKDEILLHRSGRFGSWTDGETLWIVDTEAAKVVRTIASRHGAWTDDSWYYVYKDGDEHVYLRWDTLEEACRTTRSGNYSPAILSPDGRYLAGDRTDEEFVVWDASTGEELWRAGHNSGNTIYGLAFADSDTLIASHEELQIYRVSDQALVYDSGKDRTTYSFDVAAGRLVMPLRAGGCLLNLMPQEEDVLPHMTVESRKDFNEEGLIETTYCFPLAGNWNGSTFGFFDGENWLTVERDEPGLVYILDDREYVLYPVNGVMAGVVYVSSDNQWQALIRGEEVDIFRASEGPEPVMTIPGNGYTRLCAAISGNVIALGSYVENLVFYDLSTGDCLGTVATGAMCNKIQFSRDGKHIIALSAMAAQATVANTDNLAAVMKIPLTEKYGDFQVGFNSEGSEAVVLYPDGHADVGLMYQGLDTLVEKARRYTE